MPPNTYSSSRVAFLAQAAWLFISFARTKETKQRKFAVCTFLPTPVGDSTKEKELVSLKQLFVLNGNTVDFLYAPPLNAGISNEEVQIRFTV